MTMQPCLQIIAINILPNISQRKGNQAMKCVELIEYKKYFSSKIMQIIIQGD